MAEYFVLRLGHQPDQRVQWIAVDDNGTRRGEPGSGSLADASAAAAARPVIVLVPATDVLTTTVNIPVRGGARLHAALPFALEEHLADDVDTLHFAAGDRRETGSRAVAVVAQAKIDAWLEQLKDAGIDPVRLVPENYGLARIPGTLSVLVAEDCVMFNDGEDLEFVLEGLQPSDALVAAHRLPDRAHDTASASEHEAVGHLLVYCEPEDESRLSHEWLALRQELDSVDINVLPDGVLPRLAVTVATGAGVDLLQGRYGARTDYSAYFKPWRRAAALLLGLLIIGFVGKGVDYYRLSKEEDTLRAQFTEEYRQIRPQDSREILDPVSAVRSIRQGTGTAAGPQVFLPSLLQLSKAIAQNDSARIETISYRAGVIDVRLTSPDVATLDEIQKVVRESGQFQASIQSTDQVADQISSRLQIREAGS
jgi:general secretion pathway protein L